MAKIYFQGETVRQKAYVTDESGALIDPSSILITVVDSGGVKKVEAQAMSKDATGKYHHDYLLASDAALGQWLVEVKAVLGFTAIEQDQFTVVESAA